MFGNNTCYNQTRNQNDSKCKKKHFQIDYCIYFKLRWIYYKITNYNRCQKPKRLKFNKNCDKFAFRTTSINAPEIVFAVIIGYCMCQWLQYGSTMLLTVILGVFFYFSWSYVDGEIDGRLEPIGIVLCVLTVFLFVYGLKQFEIIDQFIVNGVNSKSKYNKMDHIEIFEIVFSLFLGLLDVTTDLNLIVQWLISEEYFWFSVQLFIIVGAQVIGMLNLGDKEKLLNKYFVPLSDKNIGKWDRIMTFLGLGRAWMGSNAISDANLVNTG